MSSHTHQATPPLLLVDAGGVVVVGAAVVGASVVGAAVVGASVVGAAVVGAAVVGAAVVGAAVVGASVIGAWVVGASVAGVVVGAAVVGAAAPLVGGAGTVVTPPSVGRLLLEGTVRLVGTETLVGIETEGLLAELLHAARATRSTPRATNAARGHLRGVVTGPDLGARHARERHPVGVNGPATP
ncbi:MAG TPA: hypothetical protein VMU14_21990 [Acidimicrobiales bacterium]|nr:hypothetical protein [Acidimicrobiales bacterium]